jgi:hypothetical protein
MSAVGRLGAVCYSLRVSGRRDKVEQGVHSVVPETGITLDAGLFGENVIVLPFEVG